MQPLEFYFDFASPYGYFMSEKLEALAQQHGRSVTWRPILLFAALRAQGLPAPLEHPVKRAYFTSDFARSARYLGVEYRLPEGFPALTQHAARAFYLLQQQRGPDAAVPFARAVLRAYFREGRDIGDIGVIAQLWIATHAGAGHLAEIRAGIQSDTAKRLLQEAVTEAVAQQVFGSPFVVVDGEGFFGVDRLPQIAAKLAGQSSHARSAL